MKLVKKLLFITLVIFIVAQFFRPEKNEGSLESVSAFLKDTKPPKQVKKILEQTCYDCHSDVTKYPWYNNITPVNYWLSNHIKHGKEHFNLSLWESYTVKRKDHKFKELIEMVENKTMPLPSYTWTHAEAKLTNQDIEAVKKWANLVRMGYALAPRPE